MKKYLLVLLKMTVNVFLTNMNRKLGFVIFFVGKMVRVLIYFLFIFYALSGSRTLGQYTSDQVIFFFLTFTLIDSLGQLLFRNIYTFRNMVVSGGFDHVLLKPINPLFRVLLGGIDLIDAITIPIIAFFCIWWGQRFSPSVWSVITYLSLIINSLLLAAAFHTAVAAFGIITFEIDHLIMIYRDIENMGRFPVDIYGSFLKNILTFAIPIGVMMTVPTKALFGLMSFGGIAFSFLVGIIFFLLSIKFWCFALKRYTSASS